MRSRSSAVAPGQLRVQLRAAGRARLDGAADRRADQPVSSAGSAVGAARAARPGRAVSGTSSGVGSRDARRRTAPAPPRPAWPATPDGAASGPGRRRRGRRPSPRRLVPQAPGERGGRQAGGAAVVRRARRGRRWRRRSCPARRAEHRPAAEENSTNAVRSRSRVSSCRFQAASTLGRSTASSRSGVSDADDAVVEHTGGVHHGGERVLGRDAVEQPRPGRRGRPTSQAATVTSRAERGQLVGQLRGARASAPRRLVSTRCRTPCAGRPGAGPRSAPSAPVPPVIRTVPPGPRPAVRRRRRGPWPAAAPARSPVADGDLRLAGPMRRRRAAAVGVDRAAKRPGCSACAARTRPHTRRLRQVDVLAGTSTPLPWSRRPGGRSRCRARHSWQLGEHGRGDGANVRRDVPGRPPRRPSWTVTSVASAASVATPARLPVDRGTAGRCQRGGRELVRRRPHGRPATRPSPPARRPSSATRRRTARRRGSA